jgi:NAD(P)-dependent dehydrogenase (short-subunit alcohol dehydrogenase family)
MSLNPRIEEWRDRVVWLVGASSGIGRATAERLHDAGAQVVVSARNVSALEAFTRSRPRAIALPLDVTQAAAVHAASTRLVGECGRIDMVMYCAGHYKAQRATQFDIEQMRQHLTVNLGGLYNLLDAVLPQLIGQAQAGTAAHLSLVASVAGYRGLPHALAYGPTKAAMINLAEVLHLDLRPLGIGVSVINPGFVETPLTADNQFDMPGLISPEQAARHIVEGWASGRFEIHFPRRFTLLMKALRLMPDALYFAMVRRTTGL